MKYLPVIYIILRKVNPTLYTLSEIANALEISLAKLVDLL